MGRIEVSEEMKRRALDAFERGVVLKETDEYEVYELAPGFMDHLALLLWKVGKDFSNERPFPNHFILPTDVAGRRGYLIARETLLQWE